MLLKTWREVAAIVVTFTEMVLGQLDMLACFRIGNIRPGRAVVRSDEVDLLCMSNLGACPTLSSRGGQ